MSDGGKGSAPRPKSVVGVFDRVMCEELTPTHNDLDMIASFTTRFCPTSSPNREDFRKASREAMFSGKEWPHLGHVIIWFFHRERKVPAVPLR